MSTVTCRTLPAATSSFERQHAATGLDPHGVPPRQAVVERVLGHAAHAVAAHFGFAAVGIEHAHPHVRTLGGQDEDQPVGPDAEVAVGNGEATSPGRPRFRNPST